MSIEKDFGTIMSVVTQELGIAGTAEQAGVKDGLASTLGLELSTVTDLRTSGTDQFQQGRRTGELLGKLRNALMKPEDGVSHE